jgi:hypothetical protein
MEVHNELSCWFNSHLVHIIEKGLMCIHIAQKGRLEEILQYGGPKIRLCLFRWTWVPLQVI